MRRSTLAVMVVGTGLTMSVTLCAVFQPVYALVFLIVGGLILASILRPHQVGYTLAFLTAAFPKAGVKIGEFPFPVFLFGLAASLILVIVGRGRRSLPPGTTLILMSYFALVLGRTVIFLEEGVASAVAFAAWAAVPVAMTFIGVQVQDAIPKLTTAIQRGFIVAVAFGLVQFVGGVEQTAVPGLTYALGDDLTSKNNVIYVDVGEDYSKIPSTYQNGNIFGLVAAAFFAMALTRLASRRATGWQYALLVSSAIAIALSGSRTAVVAAVVAFVAVFLRGGHVGKKLTAVGLLGIAVAVVIQVQPGLVYRNSLDAVTSTGGAGRIAMWARALNEMSVIELLFGTSRTTLVEGWLGIIMQLGIAGLALLAVSMMLLVRRRRALWLPWLVLAIGALLDSSYLLFPTWFLFAALSADGNGPGEGGTSTPPQSLQPVRDRDPHASRTKGLLAHTASDASLLEPRRIT